MDDTARLSFGEMRPGRKADFLARGYRGRQFFAHRLVHLPKCGPDGFKLACRMCSEQDPAALSELVLYAAPELAGRFPADLWYDDDLIWHQQQTGLAGQVATVSLRRDGEDLYTMAHLSDLVQRISRRREVKSRVENHFRHWPKMLLNGILDHACRSGFKRVFVPTSRLAMKNTDPARNVGPELFERVYDRAVRRFTPLAKGDWWQIDVAANRDRIVSLDPGCEPLPSEKTICICHDIELGLGHVDTDPEFAQRADSLSPGHLQRMVELEHHHGIAATYHVVGKLLGDVRPLIESAGHAVAFHGFDHDIRKDQIRLCRKVDYRLKGYRPPQSRMTGELSDRNLCFHNFEWLASSRHSLGLDEPRLENGIARIPIQFDDFSMYREGRPFEQWRAEAMVALTSSSFVAFSLHDCYAEFWIDHYAAFLEEIGQIASFRTLDQVAASLALRASTDWREKMPAESVETDPS